MSIDVGPYLTIREAKGPRAYEVRSGRQYLSALEDGDVRQWSEYHLILIDERTGYVTIEGGYGTFAYGWPNIARGEESVHAFLYDLHFDYFMGKAAKQAWRVSDLDATLKELRGEIIEDRRRGDLDASDARQLWDDLEECEPCSSDDEFLRHLFDHGRWVARLDYSSPLVMIDHPAMRRFWNEVWKPFAEDVLRPHWLDHAKKRPLPARRALVLA